MSSKIDGSFLRGGGYPLEADYVFPSEQELIEFYSDSVKGLIVYQGWFKIVGEGDNQSLYWVVKDGEELKFKKLIENLDISNIKEELSIIQNFLEGYEEDDKLKDILDDFYNQLKSEISVDLLRQELMALIQALLNRCHNLQTELDLTQQGVGLSGDGAYNADKETYYLKDATSVMNALKILDGLIHSNQIDVSSIIGVEDTYYDSSLESLVIIFKMASGESQRVRIPVSTLIREWDVDNNGPTKVIELTREEVIGEGPDRLSADVRISSNKVNILEKDGNTLLVRGTSDNIIHEGAALSDVLTKLIRHLVTIYDNYSHAVKHSLEEGDLFLTLTDDGEHLKGLYITTSNGAKRVIFEEEFLPIVERLKWKVVLPVCVVRLFNWENVDKFILGGKEYDSDTPKIVFRDPIELTYQIIPKEGYGTVKESTGTIKLDLGELCNISLQSEKVLINVVINEGIKLVIVNNITYTLTTTVEIPYSLGSYVEIFAEAEEGWCLTSPPMQYFHPTYKEEYDIIPTAKQPTLKIEINEGIEKITLNEQDEYTELEIIKVPYQSTINWQAFAKEDYNLIHSTINWDTKIGVWNESEEPLAYDNKRFTCGSPGSNGITKIRCTFSGVLSITFKFRSDAESTYDYLSVSLLDTELNERIDVGVSDHTSGLLGVWKTFTFDSLDTQEHFVEFLYGKDNSQDTQPDNAQVYISDMVGSSSYGVVTLSELKEYVISPLAELSE